MAMIEGIDAGSLINAYRQGQSDRVAQQKTRMEQQRQQQVQGLMGQLYSQPTTLANQAQAPSQTSAQPQTFDQAFSPEGLAQAGPQPSTQPTAQPTQAPSRQPNPDVLKQLIVLDPEMGGKIATAFKGMDETALKQAEAKNTMMAAAAHALARLPQEQRGQYLQGIAGQLQEVGFTPQELAKADLSDNGLHMLQATGIDVDKMIDNELAEREFGAGKVVSVAPGGMAVRIRPEGGNEVVIAPGGTPAAGSRSSVPQVSSPDEAMKLPPGTQFMMPDGRIGTVPGGGGSNATGGF